MAAATSCRFLVFTLGLLICGTLNSLCAKLIYGLQSVGAGGHVHYFQKPWFQTTNMFVFMILCMGIYYLKLGSRFLFHTSQHDHSHGEEVPLLPVGQPPGAPPPSKGAYWVAFVSVADLAATGLMFSGLVFTTASVYQMLRGAEVIFCTFLAIVFLRKNLDPWQKAGVVITVIGITVVGAASLLRDTSGDQVEFPVYMQLFGIFLIVLAQLLQAIQMTIEEWILQHVHMDPMELAGWEGLWGGVLCVFLVLPLFQTIPGPDMGALENTSDSLTMLLNNRSIVLMELLNGLSIVTYNYFGLTLTRDFTAMHRVIIEACRSMLVWVVDLAIFYIFSHGTLGESWSGASWIQLVGFLILLVGTAAYNYTTLYEDMFADDIKALPEMEDFNNQRSVSIQSKGSDRSRGSTSSGRPHRH